MKNIINVSNVLGSECYLIYDDMSSILVDTGFSFCANQMVSNVKSILKSKNLDYIFLTHSHYDHASGCAYCKRQWPDVKIVASEYATKILSKPSVITTMKELNDSEAKIKGYEEYEDLLDKIHVDIVVKNNDKITVGKDEYSVIYSPGHTKCSIAFYDEHNKFLIGCETMGVYADEEKIAPCYLIGYEISMQSIKNLFDREVNCIIVPHCGAIYGDECKKFMQLSLFWNKKAKDIIIDEYLKGKSYEEIFAVYKQVFYTEFTKKIQPIKAFELNTSYLIPMIIKECG